MKKLSILFIFVLAVLSSCTKYNEDNFKGYDELAKPNTSKANYAITLTDVEYSNTIFPTTVRNNKYFDVNNQFATYATKFLSATYFGADAGAAAVVTYKFLDSIPSHVKNYSDTSYTLGQADYEAIYGAEYSGVNGLSPLKTPASTLPTFLASKFPNATGGKSKIIEYDYYSEVPESKVYLDKAFTDAIHNAIYQNPDYINRDTANLVQWKGISNSYGQYLQISSYQIKTAPQQCWLITPKIDFTSAIAPQMSMTYNVGNFTNQGLAVYISSDFDGNDDNASIRAATWTKICDSFAAPTSGYANGQVYETDLTDAAKGKQCHIAFVYEGQDTLAGVNTIRRTTTYQLVKFKIEEKPENPINPVKAADAWTHNGTTWTAEPIANTITLQPDDYVAAGLGSYMTWSQAPNYVPVFLNQKLPFAQENLVATVVYKTSVALGRADQYVKQNGSWTPVATPVEISEQYIKTTSGAWLFDPTVSYTFTEDRNVNDDYQTIATYVLNKWPGMYDGKNNQGVPYTNEEWYYGANAYYANFNFRLSGSPTSSRDVTAGRDLEFHDLTTDAEKIALLWERLKEGLNVFLQLKFPEAVKDVQGVDVYYNITVRIFYPDGKTNETVPYTFRYKCLTSGASGVAPTFEFVSISPNPPLN